MTSGPHEPDLGYGPHHTEILDTGDDSARHRPRLTGLLAVAVLALAGGAGITYVATHSGHNVNTVATRGAAQTPAPSRSASAPPGHRRGPGGFGPFGGLGGFGFGGLGGAIHAQATVPKSGGGYQTVDVQRGTVTAVSSSSITIKSADGYAAAYVVSSSTEVNAQAAGIGTVKVGDTVGITATVAGKTATAASIIDITSIRSSRGSFGFPAGPRGGSQN